MVYCDKCNKDGKRVKLVDDSEPEYCRLRCPVCGDCWYLDKKTKTMKKSECW